MKMDEEIVTLDDIEIEKQKFSHYKSPIFLGYVNTNNVYLTSFIAVK